MSLWTKTAPTEPGWYWYRDFPALRETQVLRLREFGLVDNFSGVRYVNKQYVFFCDACVEIEQLPGEWWPEQIEIPPQ